MVSIRPNLTVVELAKVGRFSVRTAHELIRTGQLKSFKVGRRRYVRPEELEAFFARAASAPVSVRGA